MSLYKCETKEYALSGLAIKEVIVTLFGITIKREFHTTTNINVVSDLTTKETNLKVNGFNI